MVTANQIGIKLIGETVTISYVADPSLGHGHYTLVNTDNNAIELSIQSVWVELGDTKKPIHKFSIYDRKLKRELDPLKFTLESGATLDFYISFPAFHYEPRFGEKSAVGLTVNVGDRKLHALSPVVFERRIPLTR